MIKSQMRSQADTNIKFLNFHHHESLNNESLKDTSLLRIARKSYYI